MTVDLEHQLRTELLRQGSHAPVASGWEAIHERIATRRRQRQRRRVTGGGLLAVALVALVLAATVDRDRRSHVATRPPATTAPAGTGLPRLALGQPGLVFERAFDDPPASGVAAVAGIRRWLLAEPARSWSGRVVFVNVVRAGTGYGIGDQSPGVRVVDVNGRRGYLSAMTSISQSLGWRLEDGTMVYLTATRLSGDELVALGRALEFDATHALVAPSSPLPSGLALIEASAPGPGDYSAGSEISYRQGRASAQLRLVSGGTWVFDDLVADRLASADQARAVTVQGRAGVMTTYAGPGQSHAVIWLVQPGVIAEVRADGMDADAALALARSAKDTGEKAWDGLVARSPTTGQSSAPSDSGAPDRLGEVASSACDLRGSWLSSRAGGGDARASDAIVAKVRELRAVAVAKHLDLGSDIVKVLDDLVAAMSAGDVEAVRAIPGGGCP